MAKKVRRAAKVPKEQMVTVSICHDENGSAESLLQEVLEKSNFWKVIETIRASKKVSAEKFKVLIKPDLEIFDLDAPTGTDPRLVEYLIDQLFDKGYKNVFVGDGVGQADLWLDNREVIILADLLGYRFVTEKGNPYDILNLSEEIEENQFPKGDSLAGSGLSAHWLDADFRINFCKNKSDEENLFALGLHNLINILPLRAKDYHYRNRLNSGEVATSLLENTEVHFTIIDAFVSNHGSQGNRHANPLETHTLIAGNNLLLVDWVGALKMGLDPYVSKLNGPALRKIGLPEKYKIDGDLSNYPIWKSASPFLKASVNQRNEIPAINKLSKPWLQEVNTTLFPFKNIMDEQINEMLTPLIRDIDEHPLVHYVMIGLNYMLVNVYKMQQSWQILYDKDKLYRKKVNLGIDTKKYKAADFEAIENYILPLAQIVQNTPPDQNGIRWRYIDESVLFEYSKIIPVTFKKFVEKVDISRAVQMMYDNIGGARVPIKTDTQKRVVYQAERDIYLPQPNWMVLFGGKYIDVGKIEVMRYETNRQQIFWRTVNSQNNSADFDDGMVTFAKDPGGTKITIVARQKFALPIFWQVINMDYFPEMKNTLVSDSYVRFFSRTMANFEAVCEGRNTYIGKEFNEDYGEEGAFSKPLEAEQLKNIFSLVSGLVKKWMQRGNKDGGATSVEVDEHGYQHFQTNTQPKDAVRGFFDDLSKAVQKDVGLLSLPSKKDPS
jgi:uncharacterized protein (DUF362 family)